MENQRKFHISLNVSDLPRSVAFYRVFFGIEPAKCRPDYAKFELEDPAVVLSLEPLRHTAGGALNHLGLRVPDAATLVELQRQLEMAGITTQREENVECCYARQTKFWCADPDRNNWELYIVAEDLDHKGDGRSPGANGQHDANPETGAMANTAIGSAGHPVVWEHQLGQPVPDLIPLNDGAADEVLLRGSFNAELPAGALSHLIEESMRVLRRNGRISVHGLIADRPLTSRPSLPGPAMAVQRVPILSEPLRTIEDAGFVSVHFEKIGASCCFRHEGIGLRELLLVASKPARSPFDLKQTVLYRGPLREVSDDSGNVYRRGTAVTVPGPDAEALRVGPLSEQFAFLSPRDLPGCSTSQPRPESISTRTIDEAVSRFEGEQKA